MKTEKKELWKDIFKYALSALIISYAFIWLFMLMFNVIPEDNREIVNVLSGQLVVAGTLAVIFWHYGTSSSSDKKTDIIAKGEK